MNQFQRWLRGVFSHLGVPPPLDLPPRLSRDRTLERIRPVVERELDEAERQLIMLGLYLPDTSNGEEAKK